MPVSYHAFTIYSRCVSLPTEATDTVSGPSMVQIQQVNPPQLALGCTIGLLQSYFGFKGLKTQTALSGTPELRYGTSPAVWDHTVLPATRHK